MSEREWQQVLPLARGIKEERLRAAHGHLVNGLSMAKAGEPDGLSRQNVHDTVNRVLEKRGRLAEVDSAGEEGMPAGHVRLILEVPRKHAEVIRRFAAALAQGVALSTAIQAQASEKMPNKARR